jgi:phosphoglycolate phosphatase-like HAD superfamily hydrolase
MYRNIIWDFDGTLFDTYPAMSAAFQGALKELGADESVERITDLLKISMSACATALAAHHGLDPDQILRRFEPLYSAVAPHRQPPFPGVIAVCDHVRRIGGHNLIFTHRGRLSTERLLAAHNMLGLFTQYLTNDDGFPQKPDPAAFLALIGGNKLRADETLAVGDRDIDVLAGAAAGLFTCRFGAAARGAVADLTIASFEELLRFLALAG